MKVYTKTGDKGKTSLIGGSRISKADMRVWTYGTIDEANSVLGLARSVINEEELNGIILKIQKKLFELGAELASIGTEVYKTRIINEDVIEIEKIIDKYQSLIKLPNTFIVPGGSFASAQLDTARTIIRKAERYAVQMANNIEVSTYLMKYINRLSDMLYILARYIDFKEIFNESKKKIENVIYEKKGLLDNSLNINREFAQKIVKNCVFKAKEISVPMVICITDNSGNIIVLERMDRALIASIDIAQNKAYTACVFKIPTNELHDLSTPKGELFGINNLKKVITFGGGFPLKVNDEIVGAIGVSGGTVDQDILVAEYGVKTFKEVL